MVFMKVIDWKQDSKDRQTEGQTDSETWYISRVKQRDLENIFHIHDTALQEWLVLLISHSQFPAEP